MITASVVLTRAAVAAVVAAPGPSPAPGGGGTSFDFSPTAPPGAEKFMTILHIGAWGVLLAGVLGFFVVAGMMILSHRRGEGGGEHMGAFAKVLLGLAIASSAGGLVGLMT